MTTLNKKALFPGICEDEDSRNSLTSIIGEEPFCPETVTSESHKLRSAKSRCKKNQSATQTKRKTSLYLSPEKLKELKVLCAEIEISMTTFIEEAIDSKMKSEFRKRDKEAENQSAIES